jgi:hypothetical protein
MDRYDAGLVLINVLVLLVGFAVGWWEGRKTRREIVVEAATATLDLLREKQILEDRTTVMPPLVSRSDAYEHANRRGLSLMEAAGELTVSRSMALIEQNLQLNRMKSRQKTEGPQL